MASTFPTSLDTFTNPTATSLLTSPSHSLSHSNLNDAVEALETKVGIGNTVLGNYIAYTPTFTAGLTIGDGTVTGFYCRVNGFVHVWGRAVLGGTSSVTGAVNLTVPVSIDATVAGTFLATYIGQIGIRDANLGVSYGGVVQTLGTAGFPTRVALQLQDTSGTYSTGAAISATAPMTWAAGDTIWWNMYYEAG